MVGNGADLLLRQHRTIPALRLKHRSGSCGTSLAVSALRIMRYCPKNPSRLPGIFAIRLHRCAAGAILFTEPMRKEVANAMNDAELDSLMGKGASV